MPGLQTGLGLGLTQAGWSDYGTDIVRLDVAGNPSTMVRIPAFYLDDIKPEWPHVLHPAFIAGGVELPWIEVAKYPASLGALGTNLPVSRLGGVSWVSINFDDAVAACRAKGAGWHLTTQAEMAAVALLSWKEDFEWRGNTQWGGDHVVTSEVGTRVSGGDPGVNDGLDGRILHGSSVDANGRSATAWYHDGKASGVWGGAGDAWEWRAMRLLGRRLQVLPNNDAALPDTDLSATSTAWREMLEDGGLVVPGTADTLRYDSAAGVSLATNITSAVAASQMYKSLGLAAGITAPVEAMALGLYPHAASQLDRGRVYVNTDNTTDAPVERVPIGSGSWDSGGGAGAFALHCSSGRADANWSVGFRLAFVAI